MVNNILFLAKKLIWSRLSIDYTNETTSRKNMKKNGKGPRSQYKPTIVFMPRSI